MLPRYEHTQKGSKLVYYIAIFMILELIAIEVLIFILATHSQEVFPKNQLILIMLLIPLLPAIILGWAFLMMSSLTVSIDQEYIRLRFGPSMWKKAIPLNNITECNPVQNTWTNGWGIHYIGKGCWLYNIAGLDAVEILLKNGKRKRIGTDEPEELAEAIRRAIEQTAKTAI